MRSLLLAFRPRNGPGLYRGESEDAILIHGNASISSESGIEWLVLLVFGMCVLSIGVGLPDFEYGIRDGNSVAIKDVALNDYAFAAHPVRRQIVTVQPLQPNPEVWSNRL
jgi:hypothetical protein